MTAEEKVAKIEAIFSGLTRRIGEIVIERRNGRATIEQARMARRAVETAALKKIGVVLCQK